MEMGDGDYDSDSDYDSDGEVSDGAEILSWLENNSSRLIKQEFKLIAKFDRFSEIETNYWKKCYRPKGPSQFHFEIGENEIFRYISSYLPLITMNYKNGGYYVSILLRSFRFSSEPFVLSCVTSVIDSSGKETCSTSYLKGNIQKMPQIRLPIYFNLEADGDVHFHHNWLNIHNSLRNPTLHNFISLETLRRSPHELLPNDCLTLQIACDLHFMKRIPIQTLETYLLSIRTVRRPTGPFIIDSNFLRLDPEVHQALCETSDYLKTVHIIRMLEYRERYLNISVIIIRAFSIICEIVKKARVIEIKSFEDFYKMFILADYYNYGSICDACRIIEACLFDGETVPEELRGTDVTHINGLKYTCTISPRDPIVTLELLESDELEV